MTPKTKYYIINIVAPHIKVIHSCLILSPAMIEAMNSSEHRDDWQSI